ncbi:hypothetical protein [Pectobacterium brasiliense]|uniref:hypothetical protein n=1 Tax=Pectobacterium brasiliense TaxID=180957 RepID=UPI0012D72BED|nr:hypothetical protein [Pectobacterium brasiliense]
MICFLDALVFEKSIADWVSSTANVVMAGAALYAAYHAKDWLTPARRKFAFDEFIKAIQDTDHIFLEMISFFPKIMLHTQSEAENFNAQLNEIDDIRKKLQCIIYNYQLVDNLGYKIDEKYISDLDNLNSQLYKLKYFFIELQEITGEQKYTTAEEQIQADKNCEKYVAIQSIEMNLILESYNIAVENHGKLRKDVSIIKIK